MSRACVPPYWTTLLKCGSQKHQPLLLAKHLNAIHMLADSSAMLETIATAGRSLRGMARINDALE
jgi:hypothetical protein